MLVFICECVTLTHILRLTNDTPTVAYSCSLLERKCTEGKGFVASANLFSLDRGQGDIVASMSLLRLALCHRTFLDLFVPCIRSCPEKADPFNIHQRPLRNREVGSKLNVF